MLPHDLGVGVTGLLAAGVVQAGEAVDVVGREVLSRDLEAGAWAAEMLADRRGVGMRESTRRRS